MKLPQPTEIQIRTCSWEMIRQAQMHAARHDVIKLWGQRLVVMEVNYHTDSAGVSGTILLREVYLTIDPAAYHAGRRTPYSWSDLDNPKG